ncbi:hypothetical protein CHCC20335_2029 [Bacillus paralicheniformis]|uniref:Uncharacterized protein n=1 Tax=Bacillus sonorensis L12 TaxID=1274524 RepID=M5P4V3_9BACI|nr:hypothetical protein BSONL12_08737 [Bacillus sonorensis L12]TWK79091.1 hypothetical protein CHCC20335_2029 [Bacillus paralicheniformis]
MFHVGSFFYFSDQLDPAGVWLFAARSLLLGDQAGDPFDS